MTSLENGSVLRNTRASNIELLRILAIIGVIILHINNPAMGGGISFVEKTSINYYLVLIGESVCIISVNVFVAISGYFLVYSNQRSGWRVVELLMQVVVFNILIYTARCVTGEACLSLKAILANCFPTNYFVVLYCTLYIVSPYLNIIIRNISSKEFKRLIVIFVVLFSLIPTCIDVIAEITGCSLVGLSPVGAYGNQNGYTIVNFVLMYFLGAYIRKEIQTHKIKIYNLLLCTAFCVLLLTIWAILNDVVGFGTERSAWEYCNPIVILESCTVLIIFIKIQIGTVRIINYLSKAAFTAFLLQGYFISFIDFEIVFQKKAFEMCLLILIISVAFYMVSWIIDIIYRKTFFSILLKIEKNHSISFMVGES